MELIAGAKIDRGLVHGRMKGVLIVELHVEFQLSGDIASHHQAEKSAVRPFVDELVAHLVIHIDRAKLSREFDGKEERLARRSDAPVDGIVGVIQKELREDEKCLAPTPLCRRSATLSRDWTGPCHIWPGRKDFERAARHSRM